MAYTEPQTWPQGGDLLSVEFNREIRDQFRSMGPHLLARKLSDQQVTSSTVLVNDTALVTPSIPVNEIWLLRFLVIFTGANATGDIKVAFTFPSGRFDASVLWANVSGGNFDTGARHGGSTSPTTATAYNGRGTTDRVFMPIEGVFANAGTAGAVQLQWAQNTSSGTPTTVYTNSTVWGCKIA